jgi:outer membrane protein OmpA-like peptidoglycan-associated protein
METPRGTIMKIKTFLLCTGTMALCMGSYSANAESLSSMSGPRYTPRPAIMEKNYTRENHAEDRRDIESYEQYEEREPCQHYRRLPRNYNDNCARQEIVKADVSPAPEKVIRSYTILFDHDKSGIRPNENATLDRAMKEINKYNPREITVTGYTDSSGMVAYNQKLSREREQAVSKALLARGMESKTLDREARGEYDQAVKTADGVKNQKNRRVVIDFRR